jgi:hypothetical protein
MRLDECVNNTGNLMFSQPILRFFVKSNAPTVRQMITITISCVVYGLMSPRPRVAIVTTAQ